MAFLANLNTDSIILAGAGVIVLLVLIWLWRVDRRLNRLTAGTKTNNLEQAIYQLLDQVKQTDKTNEEIKQHLIKMEERLRKSVQHVKTIRFNPFPDQGGNQSFAIGLLNEGGDGTVISSLYSREKTSVYAKPIKSHQSEYELSREERAALS